MTQKICLEDQLFKMFQQNLAEKWKYSLNEFAHNHGGHGGDYLKALASAWYNDAFTTGSLQKGIKSKQDVERLLQRGIVCPDGKTRKYNIDYNANFDGVDIYSDDYYEHGDHDDTIDSRTGQKWGPYEHITFHDSHLDESWSTKYKKSINCSHPKGFSQKAHCAGKKKHNESMITMEATCPDCGMCQTHGNLNEIAKGVKDSNGVTKCWPGKHAEGTKKGRNGGQVRNCVPNESIAEAGMPSSVVKSKQRYATMTDQEFHQAHKDKSEDDLKAMAWRHGYGKGSTHYVDKHKKGQQGVAEVAGAQKCWPGYRKTGTQPGTGKNAGKRVNDCEKIKEDEVDEAAKHGLYYNVNKRKAAGTSRPASSPKAPTAQAWKDAAKTAKSESVAEDWNKVNHHDKTNGLSQKAVNSYRREHPGSKLKTAVTTKPSKLKAGSKAAKRRKSFCARMGGNKGPMKKPNGKPTPKALALRRWNCESIEEMQELIKLAEQHLDTLFEKSAIAYPFAGRAVGQKAGKAGQLKGSDAGKLGGKQPTQGKLVGGG